MKDEKACRNQLELHQHENFASDLKIAYVKHAVSVLGISPWGRSVLSSGRQQQPRVCTSPVTGPSGYDTGKIHKLWGNEVSTRRFT